MAGQERSNFLQSVWQHEDRGLPDIPDSISHHESLVDVFLPVVLNTPTVEERHQTIRCRAVTAVDIPCDDEPGVSDLRLSPSNEAHHRLPAQADHRLQQNLQPTYRDEPASRGSPKVIDTSGVRRVKVLGPRETFSSRPPPATDCSTQRAEALLGQEALPSPRRGLPPQGEN